MSDRGSPSRVPRRRPPIRWGTTVLTQPAPALGPRDIFRRFWPDARPFRVWLGIGLLLVVTAPLLDTATIWLFKLLVDNVLVVRNLSAFGPIAAAYVAITVLAG